jgi:hypothetical protein
LIQIGGLKNNFTPHLGEKEYIAVADNEEEACKVCQNWNNENDPGTLKIRAGYEEVEP